MVKVEVNPGVCGLKTVIKVESEDMQSAVIEIQSACPHIQSLGEELKEADAFEECFAKFSDSTIYKLAGKHCKHIACPVPSAIIKGIEAECGLALPRNVEINITKE